MLQTHPIFTTDGSETDGLFLEVNLPHGKTTSEILADAEELFEEPEAKELFFGKHVKIYGRITTGLAMFLGHQLAHICKSVSLFDPKENKYNLIISH